MYLSFQLPAETGQLSSMLAASSAHGHATTCYESFWAQRILVVERVRKEALWQQLQSIEAGGGPLLAGLGGRARCAG